MNRIVLIAIIALLIIAIAWLVYFLVVLPSNNQANQQGSQNSGPGNTFFEIQGVKVEILKQGEGEEVVEAGDVVSVHYEAMLEDGTVVDSSYERGFPFTAFVDEKRTIKGWYLGIQGMKVGEKRKLIIPPELGYGTRSVPNIPPNSTLVFEIEVLQIRELNPPSQ